MKTVTVAIIFVTAIYVVLGAFFLGMIDLPDSAFYYAIGEYVKTGKYPFTYPYIYSRPTTISPPLYGIFLIPLWEIARSDIVVHFLQTLLLVVAGYFIYRSSRIFLNTNWSFVTALFFILIPGNTIFTNLVMTEIGAQLLVSIFGYLMLRFIISKKQTLLHIAVFLGLVMGLWKYSLIVYGLLALLILIIAKPKIKKSWVFSGLGLMIIVSWIFINHSITKVWGLSDASGIQMYNLAVWNGRLLPSKDNKYLVKLRFFTGEQVDLYRPYWDLQEYILSKNNRNWWEVNSLLGSVAFAAIKENPLGYASVVTSNFFRIHGPTTFYESDWRGVCQNAPADFRPFYNPRGTFRLCSPIISGGFSSLIWDKFISLNSFFYIYIFPAVNYLVLFPTLFILLLKGGLKDKLLASLYLVGVGSTVMIAHLDQRYLMPFYPIGSILISIGISRFSKQINRILSQLKNYKLIR